MDEAFARTALLLGREGIERLQRARVAVFGIGGVGGYAAEALARSGVGHLDLVDSDRVSPTNLNRQIIALRSTIGRPKTEIMAERIRGICPETRVTVHNCFYLPETAGAFDFTLYDYVVDAVDTVAAKLTLILESRRCRTPVISAMGAGNHLDPTRLRVSDLSETVNCPLARIMRKELRRRGVEHLRVAWTDEEALVPDLSAVDSAETPAPGRRTVPGSAIFVPAAMGLAMASEVVRNIAFDRTEEAIP